MTGWSWWFTTAWWSPSPPTRTPAGTPGCVVESITAYEDAGRNTRLEGTVLETDTRDETLRVRLSDGGTLTVDVSGASFLTADGGSTSLRRLSEDDRVQLFGDYSGNRFVATLVILL